MSADPPSTSSFLRDQTAPRPSRRGLLLAGIIALVVAALLVVLGVLGRRHAAETTKTWTDAQAAPSVSVVSPRPPAGPTTLVLPGALAAFYNAPIFSRVPGYVRMWRTDIGARVKKGELLAVIDTPELDQQILQARANLQTALANRQLAATTAARWTRLLAQDAVSKQETDEKTGDLAAKTAEVAASRADLQRLLALKGFSRITAPFAGVVTARKVDIGTLVNSGASASANSELFDVSEIDKLRLYVRVPQVNSAEVRDGIKVSLQVPEYPGKTFPARIDTTSSSISDASGTLLAELLVDNPQAALKPGAFAQVTFDIPPGAGSQDLLLPSSALLFRNQGMEVALVDADGRVRIQKVKTGRDLGAETEIASGLSPADRVINNPPDSIAAGQRVRVEAEGARPPGPAAGSAHAS